MAPAVELISTWLDLISSLISFRASQPAFLSSFLSSRLASLSASVLAWLASVLASNLAVISYWLAFIIFYGLQEFPVFHFCRVTL
jgi:hypothetical protein